MKKILHIDASGRQNESTSRQLSKQIIDAINQQDSKVVTRDVSQGLPFLNDTMIDAYFTAPEQRTEQQNLAISISDDIVQELLQNDVFVIGTPIYNFSMPAGLKAWADLAARVGVTFNYGENGPVGLLQNKKAYVVVTSGGTKVDSSIDFFTPWLRHFLGFIGVTDVEVIKADGLGSGAEQTLERANSHIASLQIDSSII